ncbi:MAG: glycosyltransferase family 2 protein [Coriobacteriia bacterium]|nr:glycosyltransferase family 2 protein [Coriobacteriia bacterium]
MSILISYVVPCYQVADFLDNCVQSILAGSAGIAGRFEVILVDDGSPDAETRERVDYWARQEPQAIRAIHQANAGHGGAVNTGLAEAKGEYFKVVDADDWLNVQALALLLKTLLGLSESGSSPDLLLANYVYEKLHLGEQRRISFTKVLPVGRIFCWDEVGLFKPYQNILMHAAFYRTEVLRSMGLKLPTHTFYVDNIFVYLPLPSVQTLYYLDIDVYHYYIGREGQSVSESIMIARIDQQLFITRTMIDAFQLHEIEPKRLRRYMTHYLLMMMTISSILLRISNQPDSEKQRKELWGYLEQHDPQAYNRLRGSGLGIAGNLPGGPGRQIAISGYRIAQKIFKFN